MPLPELEVNIPNSVKRCQLIRGDILKEHSSSILSHHTDKTRALNRGGSRGGAWGAIAPPLPLANYKFNCLPEFPPAYAEGWPKIVSRSHTLTLCVRVWLCETRPERPSADAVVATWQPLPTGESVVVSEPDSRWFRD